MTLRIFRIKPFQPWLMGLLAFCTRCHGTSLLSKVCRSLEMSSSGLSNTINTSSSNLTQPQYMRVGLTGLKMISSQNFILFYFFQRLFIFGTERDRAWTGEGQRERETQNRKQAPCSEASAQSLTRGSNSRTARSWPGWSRTLNRLRHPGAP